MRIPAIIKKLSVPPVIAGNKIAKNIALDVKESLTRIPTKIDYFTSSGINQKTKFKK